MKAFFLIAIFATTLCLSIPHALAWSDQTGSPDALGASAATIVTRLAAGDFADVVAQFDPALRAQASETDLANLWRTYVDAHGAFQSAGSPTTTMPGDPTIEQVPVQLANDTGQIMIALHPDGTIAGLVFLPLAASTP